MNSKGEFLLLIVSQCKPSVNRYVHRLLDYRRCRCCWAQLPSFRSLRKQKSLQVKEQSSADILWMAVRQSVCHYEASALSLKEQQLKWCTDKLLTKKIQSLAGLRRAAQATCLLPNAFTLSLVRVFKATLSKQKKRLKICRADVGIWTDSSVPEAQSMAEWNITVPGLKRFTQFPFDTLTTRLITWSTGRKTKKKFA